MSITIAMPKQGKLLTPFNQALEKADFYYDQDSKLIVDKDKTLPSIATKTLRDMDALADLSDCSIDLAPVGLNAFEEFNCASGFTAPIKVKTKLNLSKCTLSLAGTLKDRITSLKSAQGRTIVTSYPEILRTELEKEGVLSLIASQWGNIGNSINNSDLNPDEIATIIVRKGGIEEKAAELNALAFDLIQTGKSLKNAGFDLQSAVPVLESSMVLAQQKFMNKSLTDILLLDAFVERIYPQYNQNTQQQFPSLLTPIYAT